MFSLMTNQLLLYTNNDIEQYLYIQKISMLILNPNIKHSYILIIHINFRII